MNTVMPSFTVTRFSTVQALEYPSRWSPAVAAGSSCSGGYQVLGGGIRTWTVKAESTHSQFHTSSKLSKLRRDFKLAALNLKINCELLIDNVDTHDKIFKSFPSCCSQYKSS